MSDGFTTALGPVPSDWDVKSIGDLAVHVGSGITPTGGSNVYTDSGAMFIRSQNVVNDGLLLDDVAFIDEKTHERMKGSEVFPFDVLLNITGASIGRCCFLPVGLGPTNVNQHVCAIRLPSPNLSDAKYVSSVLVSPIGDNQIFRLNAGGNREGLNYQQLRAFRIPWPPRKNRAGIAQILTTLDNLIEKTESLIAKYQAVKRGMMHDLFTRGVDARGKLRPPQSEAPDLYKQSDLGGIPIEWKVLDVGSLGKYVNGHSFNPTVWSTHGLPIIRIQNLNGEESFNFYQGPVESNWEVFPGDLLFAWSGTLETSFGPRIWKGPNGLLNQHIFKVVPNASFTQKEFLNLLLLHNLQRIVQSAHGFKSSFVHITRHELLSVAVPVPSADEQERIVLMVDKLESLLERERQLSANLSKTRSGLMQDLLTGKVRVKVDEFEEVGAHG